MLKATHRKCVYDGHTGSNRQMLSSSLLDNGCVQSVRVDDDRGCRSMIIDDFVRFISSTQSHCGCLKLLIANACMMGIPDQPPSTVFQFA